MLTKHAQQQRRNYYLIFVCCCCCCSHDKINISILLHKKLHVAYKCLMLRCSYVHMYVCLFVAIFAALNCEWQLNCSGSKENFDNLWQSHLLPTLLSCLSFSSFFFGKISAIILFLLAQRGNEPWFDREFIYSLYVCIFVAFVLKILYKIF